MIVSEDSYNFNHTSPFSPIPESESMCFELTFSAVAHLAFLFKKHPGLLILTPTTPDAGWKIAPGDEAYGFSDGNTTIREMMYIWLANSTGCPAVSAPVGYVEPEQGEGKLPVGLMAMGEWGAEEQLLAWAAEAESYLHGAIGGGRRRPDGWANVIKLAEQVEKVGAEGGL